MGAGFRPKPYTLNPSSQRQEEGGMYTVDGLGAASREV
jgi:hypothetical protein